MQLFYFMMHANSTSTKIIFYMFYSFSAVYRDESRLYGNAFQMPAASCISNSFFSSPRSVSPLRSVAKTCVGIGAAWLPVSWTGIKPPWEYPRKPRVQVSRAPSRDPSVTSGTGSRCVSAGTAARGSRTSPARPTA